MFDPDLIHKINSGRCFALVGSGPSCEIGYPSWEKLAGAVWADVLQTKPTADVASFERFMGRKDYPAALRQAEVELESRASFISAVNKCFKPKSNSVTYPIYEYLARWPFACYLTTNFDDELRSHLSRAGQHYSVVQNTVNDLSLLRNAASHVIVKLHADFNHQDRAILTSLDYDKISHSPEWDPFRAKLRQVFEMFDILIIGHSITDPDLRLVLSIAKNSANPKHPIYMFLANVTHGEEREYRERFNIRVIGYQDTDNSHRELKGLARIIHESGENRLS